MSQHTLSSLAHWNKRTYRTGIARAVQIFFVLAFLASQLGMNITSAAAGSAGTALQFNGTNQYVTFGDTRLPSGTLAGSPTWNTSGNSKLGASSLTFNGTSQYVSTGTGTAFNAATFTVETWFYRTAAGIGITTGTGGITSAIPLLTKGTSEGETPTADVNYFLGIDATSAKLVADFEESSVGSSPSGNHPITGTTTINLNTWYHAAATYDGNKWQLFLNGNLEGELVVGQPANVAVISPLALATSIKSNGTTIQGYFAGRLDEARVWSYARTQAEIQGTMNSEILTPTAGLLGRWGLNDAAGTTASNLNRLGVTSFTLEAWVKRAAGGITMTTGGSGFDGTAPRPNGIYPVLAKGMGEGEAPANINTNWILGITVDNFVGADFEDTAGGVNHPAWGTTPVTADGQWHHIAATYTGSCWATYVDGNVDPLNANANACPNATPEFTSYQRASLAAGINSTGGLGTGFFSGSIDEARVWNRALSAAEISANKNSELTNGAGLIARWGMNENAGTTTNSSVGTFPGTLTNSPTWTPGFPIADTTPPAAPTGLTAAPYSGGANLSWTAPADPDVAGYNVYRSISAPVPLTSPTNGATLVPGTTYTDGGLTNGTPYYYVVTAVDTSTNQSVASNQINTTPLASLGSALTFDGTNNYVTFGVAPGLGVQTFTIETWFNWTGGGTTASTGSGGVTAIPLVTKGLHEADASNVDANYFLGIAGGKLAADFEDMATGANWPVTGITTITPNTWHHAAVTYDGQTWRLYLDGVLDTSLTLGAPHIPRHDSIQYAGIGTAMNSSGVTEGRFAGKMDEVRIWNVVRAQSEIMGTINNELTAGSGLIARWGLNESVGTTIGSSIGSFPGTFSTNGPTWGPGASFNIVPPPPPAAPTGLTAVGGNTVVNLDWTANAEADLAGYNVYRFGSPSTYTKVNTSLLTSPAYIATGLTNGTLYTFVVTAANTAGSESLYSSPASATPFHDVTPPAIPSGLVATPGNTVANLAWADNTEGDLAGYNVYRFVAPSTYTKLNTGLLASPAYVATGLTNGTAYTYVVTAVDGSTNESGYSSPSTATPAEAATGLQFASASSQYVTFGNAAELALQNFTVETWFKRTGTGTAVSTGTNGVTAVPLVTKGSPQAEGSNVDENYILSIRSSDNVLAADFETYAICGARPAGDNNPIFGTTPIVNNTWYHAAFTYDGAALKLYLNGNLEATLASTCLPRYDSIQHAGLGTYLTSTGASSGYFQGALDEVRIWNTARTADEIISTINSQLTSGAGLVGRWGMGEGSGTIINSSVGSFPGTLMNAPSFVAGAPFNIAPPTEPAAPTLLSATATAGLAIDLGWTDNSDNETSFKIERAALDTGPFTQVGTAVANARVYTDGGLDPATQYCYRVFATNNVGDSLYSSNISCADTAGTPNNGLNFGSGDGYVTFGDPAALDLAQFTIETWFKRTGAGVSNTTGTDGIANAIPLVTHGAPQSEGSNIDANWILVIDDATDVIGADFEDMATGLNHPVLGTTPITDNIWHHAAATYDGTTWRLYLDGNLEKTLAANAAPRSDSAQGAGLGAMLTTTGTPLGHFNGVLDEVRIWNVARTQAEIQGTLNSAITSPQAHLVGRWGLDETSTTTTVPGSAGTTINGTITGSGSNWGAGATPIVNHAPLFVSGSPPDAATGVSTSPTLTANFSDADLDTQDVTFNLRQKDGAGADFTLAVIPDPQYLAASYPAIYNAQMQWVVDNKTSRNIPYVIGLGDNVDSAGSTTQWANATTAWDKLTAAGIPYGLAAGNHDGAPSGTAAFNSNFGSRKTGQTTTYGGSYSGSDYDNYYTYFDASGLHFIVVFIEYDDGMTSASNPVLTWANSILSANPTKRAIVVTHNLLQGGSSNLFSAQGQAVYDALKANPNLFLMLGGHLDVARRRADTFNGHTVYSLRSDYQFVNGNQSGYLQILHFSPAENTIHVSTYSPTLDQNYPDETPPQNAFDLAYDMGGGTPPTVTHTVSNVAPGADATWDVTGLLYNTQYEWYAESSDGRLVADSAMRTFTTELVPVPCYPLTLSHTGQGSNLIASPAHSTGCAAEQYAAGENVSLSGAVPTTGWQIASWTGTSNDSSTGNTNTLTMPAAAHAASVNYTAITYNISGNAGIGSAILTYSDGTKDRHSRSGTGSYTLAVSYNWSGTVTPTKAGYTFVPVSKSYTNVLANKTGENYVATPVTLTISGNAGIAGAVLSYTDGTPKTALADGTGAYSFTVSYNWSNTVTPSLAGYTFAPVNRVYTNVVTNQTAQNYVATPVTYTISGNAGAPGVNLAYEDGAVKNVTAGADGSYTLGVSYNWSGTVIPSKAGYTFTPANKSYSNILANKTSENYTATPITFTIAGNAGVASATLSYTDGTPKTATADTLGAYSFAVSYNWSGTVTPTKAGYTFAPTSKTYTNILTNQTAQNYVATPILYSISGTTTVGSVTLSYTDGTPKTATSAADGSYTFTIPSGWTGIVTPTRAGYTFAPLTRSYSNVIANQAAQNYVPTAITYTISGNAGVAGAVLSYTDGTLKTATADATGAYTFTVSYSWSGTVTPALAGYTFAPLNRTYTSVLTNQTVQNYVVTPVTYTIAGNAGVAGATLSYTDGTPKTATADAAGAYAIAVSYNWSGIVTPTKLGYTFAPGNRPYANVLVNQVAQNYVATPVTYTISGNAGVAGTVLSYTDVTPKTTTADATGAYSFTVSYNWSGTVTPTLAGYTFAPASRPYTNVLANQVAQNYVATPITYTVAGNAGVAGATLSYTDVTPKTALADGTGAYSFAVSYNWSGIVTPTKAGFTFAPVNRTYTNVLANFAAQDYVASAVTYSIAGNAGVAGVTLTYTDGVVKTVTSALDGSYTFSVPYNWSGTVTPSRTGYTFVPVDRSYTNVLANHTADNFAATATAFTLTVASEHGTVTRDNAGPYHYGDVVLLTDTPDDGWSFTSWSGDASGTTSSVSVTMDGNKSVTANYTQILYTLSISSAHGTVTKDPDQANYTYDQSVQLTPIASAGWSFVDWSGDASGSAVPLTLIMDANKSVTANYIQNGYSLTLTSLHGTVTKNPDKASYTYGESVQLTATPAGGWAFANWSGDATGTTNPVSLTMDTNKSVTANYLSTLKAMTLRSVAGYDGWVLESSENSNRGGTLNAGAPTFMVGDDAARRQYRAILSFNSAPLPDNAVITAVTLKVKKAWQHGAANPFATLGNIAVDLRRGSYSLPGLQAADFQVLPNKNMGLQLTNTPVSGWYSKALAALNFGYLNKLGPTQLRLRFVKDDNNNAIADYLTFYSGNTPTVANRPMLVIQYYVP